MVILSYSLWLSSSPPGARGPVLSSLFFFWGEMAGPRYVACPVSPWVLGLFVLLWLRQRAWPAWHFAAAPLQPGAMWFSPWGSLMMVPVSSFHNKLGPSSVYVCRYTLPPLLCTCLHASRQLLVVMDTFSDASLGLASWWRHHAHTCYRAALWPTYLADTSFSRTTACVQAF